ncbi:hypothetical protein D3C86_2117850 [compost metagenome]
MAGRRGDLPGEAGDQKTEERHRADKRGGDGNENGDEHEQDGKGAVMVDTEPDGAFAAE